MGYQFFLPIVLRWRASRAESPLKHPSLAASFQILTRSITVAHPHPNTLRLGKKEEMTEGRKALSHSFCFKVWIRHWISLLQVDSGVKMCPDRKVK